MISDLRLPLVAAGHRMLGIAHNYEACYYPSELLLMVSHYWVCESAGSVRTADIDVLLESTLMCVSARLNNIRIPSETLTKSFDISPVRQHRIHLDLVLCK